MQSRPVTPRASRIALIVASVPELTRRTISMEGTASWMAWTSSVSPSVGAPKLRPSCAARHTASTTAGWACPMMSGPHDPT